MIADSSPFQFTNERPADAAGRIVVRMPRGLSRKRQIIAKYAGQLRFPPYFGWNWDAFEECLHDLSWLDGVAKVIVVHRDVPFANSPEQRETYLSILRDRCAAKGIALEVRFPRSARNKIEDI